MEQDQKNIMKKHDVNQSASGPEPLHATSVKLSWSRTFQQYYGHGRGKQAPNKIKPPAPTGPVTFINQLKRTSAPPPALDNGGKIRIYPQFIVQIGDKKFVCLHKRPSGFGPVTSVEPVNYETIKKTAATTGNQGILSGNNVENEKPMDGGSTETGHAGDTDNSDTAATDEVHD